MEASLSQKEESKKDCRRYLMGWFGAMIVVIAGSAAVVVSRTYAISAQRSELDKVADAGPHVLVIHPQAASAERRLTLPATIQGYVETPVFAKISGYLKEIRVDKGDRVKKGQVIAILESPELDQQVADAKDNLWLQTTTDRRDAGLVLKHGISQQIADNSHGAAPAGRRHLQTTARVAVVPADNCAVRRDRDCATCRSGRSDRSDHYPNEDLFAESSH